MNTPKAGPLVDCSIPVKRSDCRVKFDATTGSRMPLLPIELASMVTVGCPLPSTNPIIAMPSRERFGLPKPPVVDIVWPASAWANVIVMMPGPVALFAANSAARSEMPFGPGLAISAHRLEISPLTKSLLFETIKLGQLCCAKACCAIIVASTKKIIVAIARMVCPPSAIIRIFGTSRAGSSRIRLHRLPAR